MNVTGGRHAISPYIYGIANGVDPSFAEEIKLPNTRWGGDEATRYNWETDSSNPGSDWFFTGGNGEANAVPGAQVDAMVKTYEPAGTKDLVTIPIIPWINKTAAFNCSYPTSVYGAQQATNTVIHPNGLTCGNGVATNGTLLKDKNLGYNNVANTTTLQTAWVDHLVSTFGTAAKSGVMFYQLDNEPGGWSNTHRDIEPTNPTYPAIVAMGEKYAAAIKAGDATANVLGPSDYPFGGWIGTPSQQNNLFAAQYYLQQMAAYGKAHNTRVLDYFDEHYYPVFTDTATQLAATRTLWDATYNTNTWVEQYFFDGPLELLPRFHSWINTYYPETKLAISEYSFDSGKKLVTDALTQADVLGIYGWQSVDFANMWNGPASTDPIAYAFRLYRNYDGDGSQFGDTSVTAASTNMGALSIYAAQRTKDGALTMVVINKTTAAINTKLTISNFKGSSSAALYSYSGANLKAIKTLGNVSVASNALTYTYPAYSATVIVVAEAK